MAKSKKRELRDPPAYLEFASAILAKKEFRAMSLQERGLLYSIKLECWVNKSVPANPEELAPFVNQGVNVVKEALTDRVKSFLRSSEANAADYECTDIEIYRQSQEERRDAQSKGGKIGAAITNAKHSIGAANSQVSCDSLIQTNLNQTIKNQSLDDDFVREYTQNEN
jgi:hypothetical protein